MLPHPATALDLLLVQRARTLRRRIVTQLVERPAQVDRGRPRRREHVVGGVEVLPAHRRERQPVRGRHADRGRTADRESANRVRHLRGRRAAQLDLLVRQAPLVEHDHRVPLETNDAIGRQLGHLAVVVDEAANVPPSCAALDAWA